MKTKILKNSNLIIYLKNNFQLPIKLMFLLFLSIVYTSLLGYSQHIEKDKIYFVSAEKTRGTFQFEVTEETFCNVNVTAELMEQIEKNRNVSEFTYLTLSKDCRVKIFPLMMIPELRKNPIEPCLIVDSRIKN
jgi:hypothetical protein